VFFPHLISGPFHDGLVIVFWLAIAMALVGAAASLMTPKAVRPHVEVPQEELPTPAAATTA
jgi:hypothetical protein